LRLLQDGEALSLPHSRPMPVIGKRCHELRITDENKIWRIVYRTDEDAILILDVFPKTTQKTPQQVIKNCQRRISEYDSL
jgi:phage-related protein